MDRRMRKKIKRHLTLVIICGPFVKDLVGFRYLAAGATESWDRD